MSQSDKLFELYQLPDSCDRFLEDWNVVILPQGTKDLLVSYAQTLRRLEPVKSARLALRRAVLLYGPPGCGKTSLAQGLPAVWSIESKTPRVGFIHVNTHALISGVRGDGPKNVLRVFSEIGEIATSGVPIFVLVDEVETLGSDRASISMETNPLDALYQVTAFLESLDKASREYPNLTFLFTTNIPKAIDRAVRERVDFVVEIPLPDAKSRSLILIDALRSISKAYDVSELLRMSETPAEPTWSAIVRKSDRLSGRALRHVLVLAGTLAGDSPSLKPAHLLGALEQVAGNEEGLRRNRGVYIEDFQGPAQPSGGEQKAPFRDGVPCIT